VTKLLFVGLNEINFDHVRAYGTQGRLPRLQALIEAHGTAETASESRYEELEPWIQWVTAHTGLSLAEHGVFRLGDILKHDFLQIWEHLEMQGLKVGAISPMNVKNRTADAAFFVPDPWTPTDLTARPLLKRLYGAVAQAVNDNAQSKVTKGSAAWLLAGAAAYARAVNYGKYISLATSAPRKPWAKAMFLDQLLADVFVGETRRTKPDFASLFLNAGAHIQHHYMFNSAAYAGEMRNPEWYVSSSDDPVYEVYALYDRIIGQIHQAFPKARLMLATALHQDPHSKVTFYWRLKDHAVFLRKIGVPFESVEPRMSRDFFISCKSATEALEAERVLASAVAHDGVPLFEVDNRGTDLFVMLTYPNDIPADFSFRVGNAPHQDLRSDVAFVAIKNGQHNGTGYFLDTGSQKGVSPEKFPLAEMPERICRALGVEWRQQP
jgi:hypothetical protein